jgi:hypothetical protein
MYAWLTVLALVTALLFGCAPTKQARSMETSGFLGDLYPRMHKGGDDEGLLIYRSPKLILIPRGSYQQIILDPVQVWGDAASDPTKQKEMQQVADILHGLVYKSLSKDYEMVTSPGPNTLRIQAALTKADKANVVLRAVSTVPAPMNALALSSLLKNAGTGKPMFVGEVSAEVKFLDAESGDVLAASADRRVGNKRLDLSSFDSWDDVYKAMEYWAEKIRFRLCEQRGGSNCVKPQP